MKVFIFMIFLRMLMLVCSNLISFFRRNILLGLGICCASCLKRMLSLGNSSIIGMRDRSILFFGTSARPSLTLCRNLELVS